MERKTCRREKLLGLKGTAGDQDYEPVCKLETDLGWKLDSPQQATFREDDLGYFPERLEEFAALNIKLTVE